MPISFLAPLFLAGLAALAVPILIHLTDRERRDVVAFPSLMFVQKVPHQTVRRQRIRHWLVFLLRSAAIVLLVLAFARPLFERAGAGGTLRQGRDVVILLDRSYSMAYGDRWQRALAAAEDAIDELGDADRASLVAFANHAEALTQPTGDPVRLHSALDDLKVTDAATRYAPALQLAAQLLEDSELPKREVVLISDFQRTGFQSEETVRLAAGTVVRPINLAEESSSNVAVLDVAVDRQSEGSQDRLSVVARIVNTGPQARSEVPVSLAIDGQQVAERSAGVEAQAASLIRFESVPVPRRRALGTVTAGEDRLERDNRFHFVISPQQAVPVVVLEHPRARSRERVYLERALDIGEEPRYAVVRRQPSQLRQEDLSSRAAIIVNDVPFPGGAIGRLLTQFAERGGRLLVILGKRSVAGSWNRAGLLPGSAGEPVDLWEDGGGTMAIVTYDHPAFELFKAPRSGDFSAARFFRYHAFEEGDSATVLARFDNGAVALVAGRMGRGDVIVLTTGLDNSWNDLTIQPVFLPFVHQLVRFLSGYAAPRPWVIAGQVLDLKTYITEDGPGLEDPGSREIVVEAPSGERALRKLGDDDEHYLEAREQGFYRLRPLRDRTGLLATIAVNLDPLESDLSVLDADELVGAVTASTPETEQAAATPFLTQEEKERRQGLWWYLLVGVLLLLVIESVVSNRVGPIRRPRLALERR